MCVLPQKEALVRQDSGVRGPGHSAARSLWAEWTHPGPSAQHSHSPLGFVAVMTRMHEAWNIHGEPLMPSPQTLHPTQSSFNCSETHLGDLTHIANQEKIKLFRKTCLPLATCNAL